MDSISARRRSSAFTLLELLAVSTTVAILVCLAIPAISSGRMTANRAKCASNMRQVGMALFLYTADNGQQFPITAHSTWREGESWVFQLRPYLDNLDKVRVCPAEEPKRQQTILQRNATSYILNDLILDSPLYSRPHNIPHPSRTMLMFILSGSRGIQWTQDHGHCAEWERWSNLLYDVEADRHRTGGRASDRTKGSANYLYADGHVENIPASEMKRMVESGEKPWMPEK